MFGGFIWERQEDEETENKVKSLTLRDRDKKNDRERDGERTKGAWCSSGFDSGLLSLSDEQKLLQF